MMNQLLIVLVALPALFAGYAYVGYPLLLVAAAAFRRRSPGATAADVIDWPHVTITLPVYNEAASIRSKLDDLLRCDYPVEARHILVISDASTDATDRIVCESYASHGVELLRLPVRRGKTAAENAAGARLNGSIVINTDATVRLAPNAIKALVRAFADPRVGVASGRDVSIGADVSSVRHGEAGYVDYEMWVRRMETQVDSIVGASGCLYAIRASLYQTSFPEALSRDFAAALIARENGYRAVSVEEAVCYVPRADSLQVEFRRKSRTMARGLETLWYKRHLLNPTRYGIFALLLASHKLCRWLVYATLPLAATGLLGIAISIKQAMLLLGIIAPPLLGAICALRWLGSRKLPTVIALPTFLIASALAGLVAWQKVLGRQRHTIWEPTRRPA